MIQISNISGIFDSMRSHSSEAKDSSMKSEAWYSSFFCHETLHIPDGIQIHHIPPHFLKIEGPLGNLLLDLSRFQGFFQILGKELHIFVKKEGGARGPQSLLRSLESFFRNHFEGISQGFLLSLECVGVGYRAVVHETQTDAGLVQKIELKIGQSHELFYELPRNVRAFSLKPVLFCLYGIEKQQVTQIAAELRQLKPPEPYKGKGIRFKDEILRLKEGKKK
jgi:large subunit ribosomal protein L6